MRRRRPSILSWTLWNESVSEFDRNCHRTYALYISATERDEFSAVNGLHQLQLFPIAIMSCPSVESAMYKVDGRTPEMYMGDHNVVRCLARGDCE